MFSFSAIEALNNPSRSPVTPKLPHASQVISVSDITMFVHYDNGMDNDSKQTLSLRTKFKAHHKVVFPNKAAATCSPPRCLKEQCIKLYSVTQVHENIENVMEKKK